MHYNNLNCQKLSGECWTLLTRNGHHAAYIAEGAGPQTHFKVVNRWPTITVNTEALYLYTYVFLCTATLLSQKSHWFVYWVNFVIIWYCKEPHDV